MSETAIPITGWPFAQAVGLPVTELLVPSTEGSLLAEALVNVARMVQLALRDGRSEAALLSRVRREHGEVLLLRRAPSEAAGTAPRRDARGVGVGVGAGVHGYLGVRLLRAFFATTGVGLSITLAAAGAERSLARPVRPRSASRRHGRRAVVP